MFIWISISCLFVPLAMRSISLFYQTSMCGNQFLNQYSTDLCHTCISLTCFACRLTAMWSGRSWRSMLSCGVLVPSMALEGCPWELPKMVDIGRSRPESKDPFSQGPLVAFHSLELQAAAWAATESLSVQLNDTWWIMMGRSLAAKRPPVTPPSGPCSSSGLRQCVTCWDVLGVRVVWKKHQDVVTQ